MDVESRTEDYDIESREIWADGLTPFKDLHEMLGEISHRGHPEMTSLGSNWQIPKDLRAPTKLQKMQVSLNVCKKLCSNAKLDSEDSEGRKAVEVPLVAKLMAAVKDSLPTVSAIVKAFCNLTHASLFQSSHFLYEPDARHSRRAIPKTALMDVDHEPDLVIATRLDATIAEYGALGELTSEKVPSLSGVGKKDAGERAGLSCKFVQLLSNLDIVLHHRPLAYGTFGFHFDRSNFVLFFHNRDDTMFFEVLYCFSSYASFKPVVEALQFLCSAPQEKLLGPSMSSILNHVDPLPRSTCNLPALIDVEDFELETSAFRHHGRATALYTQPGNLLDVIKAVWLPLEVDEDNAVRVANEIYIMGILRARIEREYESRIPEMRGHAQQRKYNLARKGGKPARHLWVIKMERGLQPDRISIRDVLELADFMADVFHSECLKSRCHGFTAHASPL